MLHTQATIAATAKIWHQDLSNIGKCQIGEYCIIHSHVWIGDEVIIGDGTKVQAFCFIPTGVSIEPLCFLGPRVTFTNDKHPPSHGTGWSKTKVGANTVIGAGATILPGITIGEGCVIGAGALVTKDIPDFHIAMGVPAEYKPLRCSDCKGAKVECCC